MTKNPFRPTFGVPPLLWVGRQSILDDFELGLLSGPGAMDRSMVISGTRGIGKTVLLNELEETAQKQGWVTLRTSGRAQMVEELTNTSIPAQLRELDPPQKSRISRVNVSALGGIGIDYQGDDSVTPTLNTRLRELVGKLTGVGVLITIDEVQDASAQDLTDIAVAYQDLLRDEMDVALVMAGLPEGVDRLLDLPGATFLRRAQRHVLGPFSEANSSHAFSSTAQGSGREFTDSAIQAAVRLSQGYPFLVQLTGAFSWAWAMKRGSVVIEPQDVEAISGRAVSAMGNQVHAPAVKSLPFASREFLTALAGLTGPTAGTAGNPPVAMADIARELGKPAKSLSDVRHRLIVADLIEPCGTGKVRFVLPYMSDYLLGTGMAQKVD
ncbi:hypothetical protein CPHO_07390 [Corynebacterium phocae]|uniref:Orc1-like AAA ATPase domain-containing protein n=1 Tax=Corynebacterium phocae TaxID=161895 RepID=A0A1L7D483_9CORY|nr:ATP-binding protein [Corynebacterium phocae]APT92742.1 hypothetical protein CPHO_07390 [Corynebacterium phocae]KAA8723052.1 ATP-binding protein [Corynebacterium phocae]